MCTGYQLCSILSIKNFDSVVAKDIACTTWAYAPPLYLLRITPHQIAHRPLMWHLLLAVNGLNLVKCVNTGRQSTMHAEYCFVHCGRQGQKVHNLGTVAPNVNRAVFAQTFVIEAIDLGDLARLMIASDQRDALLVSHLQRQ